MQTLELLIFSVGGITMGVDTRQVDGIVPPEQAREMGMEVIPLHRIIPFGRKSVHYQSPRALLLKGDRFRAVLIESPEDIIPAQVDAIRLLPAALAACNPAKAIWGVTINGDRVAILINLNKLDDISKLDKEREQDISNENQEAIP